MILIHRINKKYGTPICRLCLNERCGVSLNRQDCILTKEVELCPICRDKKRLVVLLWPIGYLKTLGAPRMRRA